jgi:hypothetical protein
MRHILAASWVDSESHYPENGGDMSLRNITPWYVSNMVIRTDLQTLTVKE